MAKYAAFLRGISPTNPNMRNEKLRSVFEDLGFSNVKTVISSGNVLFETDRKDTTKIESDIEQAIKDKLGFFSMTIIASQQQLQELVDADPFDGGEHSRKTYLICTFFKDAPKPKFKLPHKPEGQQYTLLNTHKNVLCTVVDVTVGSTLDFMSWIEKEFGKDLTTRTWNTVLKIVKALG